MCVRGYYVQPLCVYVMLTLCTGKTRQEKFCSWSAICFHYCFIKYRKTVNRRPRLLDYLDRQFVTEPRLLLLHCHIKLSFSAHRTRVISIFKCSLQNTDSTFHKLLFS